MRGKGQPDFFGGASCLDVDVVQHFEAVGDEALRTHQYAVGAARAREVADDVVDVGAAPRVARAPRALPAEGPVGPRPEVEVPRDRSGAGA